MTLPIALLYFYWAVFMLYWAVAASSVKKVKQGQTPLNLFIYRFLMVLGFSLIWGWLPFYPFNIHLWTRNIFTDSLGMVLGLAGLGTALWARKTLAGNWSSSVTLKKSHELVTDGPYRFVRHPIYTGVLLMMVGTVLVIGRVDSLAGLLLRLVTNYFKIREEEALMLKHFPKQYRPYKSKVKALVPFLF